MRKHYWIIFVATLMACVNVRLDLSVTPVAAVFTATPLPTVTLSSTITPLPTATPLPVLIPTVVPSPPLTVVSTTAPASTELVFTSINPKIIYHAPELAVDWHISTTGSYTQTQWEASGPMVCQIQRDTCAYHQLVGILDPTIIFKQEEKLPNYRTEDILIHPAMLQPLSRLSRLVQQEWEGAYKLRVTDAYDSLLEHDVKQSDPNRKYSLHFEGRAIDLTLWPVDRSRYGRLCMLAHEAGFDWVHHEGTHCHASINAKSLCMQCGN